MLWAKWLQIICIYYICINRLINHKIQPNQIIYIWCTCLKIDLVLNNKQWLKLWRSQQEEWASNYYITPATGSSNQLEKRCCRENQHPAEGALRTPDWAVAVGDQISWREDAGMRNMSQRGWAPRPPVEQPRRTRKKHFYGHKSGSQYVAVLFSLQLTSHTVKPLVTLSNPFK